MRFSTESLTVSINYPAKMKNAIPAIILSLFFSTTSMALHFVTSVDSPSKASLSKTDWVSDTTANAVKLRGKPSRNDSVCFRCYEGDFIIDSNLDARSISFYEQAFVIAENKKINSLRGGLTFVISSNPNHTNLLHLKRSEMNVNGSVFNSPTSGNKRIGMNRIRLEDSKFSASGTMDFTITSSIFEPTAGRSGVCVELVGDSIFKLKGDLLVDSLLEENKNLLFRISFEERGGKMPKMVVDRAVIGGVDLKVAINGDLKKGRYTILESTGKKPIEGTLRSVTLNDKPVQLDAPTALKDKTITISIGAADNRTKNDIIVTVQ